MLILLILHCLKSLATYFHKSTATPTARVEVVVLVVVLSDEDTDWHGWHKQKHTNEQ